MVVAGAAAGSRSPVRATTAPANRGGGRGHSGIMGAGGWADGGERTEATQSERSESGWKKGTVEDLMVLTPWVVAKPSWTMRVRKAMESSSVSGIIHVWHTRKTKLQKSQGYLGCTVKKSEGGT